MPDNIVICKTSPPLTDLGRFAEGGGIEVTQDLEAELRGESREEVDLDQVSNVRRDEGELREAALSEDALQHEISVFGRRRREQGPDVGNGLLVRLGETRKLIL